MLRSRFNSQQGSAVVGFALAFPLIAYLFLVTSDLSLSVLHRERISTITEQVLREGVRLPHTENISSEISSVLHSRGYQVEISSKVSVQNTATLVSVEATTDRFQSAIYGVYE